MEAERTNGETLIWVQSLKGYGQATLKSAKSFMHFDGDCRQLKSWKERFLMEHKKIKQDIHARLLGECVGSGKLFFSKPPTDYVPDNVKSGNKCKKQIKVLLKSLGKGPATKSDELLEKFQTAFDPPASFLENYISIFL